MTSIISQAQRPNLKVPLSTIDLGETDSYPLGMVDGCTSLLNGSVDKVKDQVLTPTMVPQVDNLNTCNHYLLSVMQKCIRNAGIQQNELDKLSKARFICSVKREDMDRKNSGVGDKLMIITICADRESLHDKIHCFLKLTIPSSVEPEFPENSGFLEWNAYEYPRLKGINVALFQTEDTGSRLKFPSSHAFNGNVLPLLDKTLPIGNQKQIVTDDNITNGRVKALNGTRNKAVSHDESSWLRSGKGTQSHNSEVILTHYLFSRLYQLGIRSVHGVPGDFNLPALDYIESAGLRWVGNATELGAGYSADGYARVKGIGALITVFGVGELSAINAIAGSYAEKVPLVHIVGVPSTSSQDKQLRIHHSLGDGDFRVMANEYKPFTCAQANLRDPKYGPDMIDGILKKCIIQSRPVYIELPFDMIHVPVSGSNLATPLVCRQPKNDHALENIAVEDLLRRIYSCKQPFIIVDGFVARYDIMDEVNELLRMTSFPAGTTPFGQGIIDERYAEYHGVYAGVAGDQCFHNWVKSCDLVMRIGPLKSDSNTYAFNTLTAPEQTIELDHHSMSIFGTIYCGLDLKPVFQKVLGLLDSAKVPQLMPFDFLRDPRRYTPILPATCPEPIDQDRFWPYISRFFQTGDTIMADAGTPWCGSEAFMLPPQANVIKSGIWMSIGYTLGSCVGAAQAQREMIDESSRDDGRTVVFEGDGSFQMTTQSISDIIRNRIDVIIFVINNDGYTIERVINGKYAQYNWIQQWKYTEIAKVFGAPEDDPDYPVFNKKATNWDELRDILQHKQLIAGKGFNLVEVVMDKQDAPAALKTFIDLHPKQNRGPAKTIVNSS